MEKNLIEEESGLKALAVPFKHSKRMQMALVVLFFVSCFTFLFVLENRLAEQQRQLEFAYKEFYLRPFHYKLDPFSYVELKNGIPITDPEPPNPHFFLSFEELLLNRFVDYYIWSTGPTDEADVTTEPDRMPLTMKAFGAHVRNRIYYRLDRDELRINPVLLTQPELPNPAVSTTPGQEVTTFEPNKLMWTTIPYCNDPILEESLHELGNIHGFLYARGNHKNFRFLAAEDSKTISNMMASVPLKLAYLHHHGFLNFTRHGLKKPIHVSIVCEPIQKKLRHFYTERRNYKEWAEDFPISQTNWWKTTLAECMNVTSENRECRYEGVKNIKRPSALDIGRTWLPRRVEWTLPQFCDYDRCDTLGERQNLDYVKSVIENDYTVVGTLEKLDDTLDLLETKVPQFFKGIKAIYKEKLAKAVENSAWSPAIPAISPEIRAEMQSRYSHEVELYNFVSNRLQQEITQRN